MPLSFRALPSFHDGIGLAERVHFRRRRRGESIFMQMVMRRRSTCASTLYERGERGLKRDSPPSIDDRRLYRVSFAKCLRGGLDDEFNNIRSETTIRYANDDHPYEKSCRRGSKPPQTSSDLSPPARRGGVVNEVVNATRHLPKGVILEGGPPDDRRRRFAAVRRSMKADVKSLDAMVDDDII